jgi:hypothetical protein
MDVLPDGGDRADVRPGRLLPQVRRPRDRGQAPARALLPGVGAAARRPGDAPRQSSLDDGRRLHDRRHRAHRLGAQPGRGLRRRRSRRLERARGRSALARGGAGAAGGAARPGHPVGGRLCAISRRG